MLDAENGKVYRSLILSSQSKCLTVIPAVDFSGSAVTFVAGVLLSQDHAYPNSGTVFKRNFKLMRELMGLRHAGAAFSRKTPNWIVNLDNAACADIETLIRKAEEFHRKKGLRVPEIEIEIVKSMPALGRQRPFRRRFFRRCIKRQ